MEAAREQALAFIEGKRRDDLTQIGHDIVVEVIGPASTRDAPVDRRPPRRGDRTYLVTAAPGAGPGDRHLPGHGRGLGTEAELVDGTYTGRLLGPVLHGPAKLDAVVRLAAEQGFDLRASSAYSDSVNDRPLLEGWAGRWPSTPTAPARPGRRAGLAGAGLPPAAPAVAGLAARRDGRRVTTAMAAVTGRAWPGAALSGWRRAAGERPTSPVSPVGGRPR
jgi:hypothetical protein